MGASGPRGAGMSTRECAPVVADPALPALADALTPAIAAAAIAASKHFARASVQVAAALSQPLEKISVEMVFRSLYHCSRAIDMGEKPELIPFLVQHAKLFGLVKAERKSHKEKKMILLEIWGDSLS